MPPPLVARVTRDYFDPAFPTGVAATVATAAAPCAADPWCIGVFTDNELGLNQSLALTLPYLDAYLLLPAGAPGKVAAQAFLAARYGGDVAAFNAVWGTALTTFDDVQSLAALSPAPASALDRPSGSPAQIADRRAFDAHVAARFHQVTYDALRALSPDLLILGSRLLILSTRPEVVAAIAPYVDVLTVNYYEIDASILVLAPFYPEDYGIPFTRMFDDLDTMQRIAGKPLHDRRVQLPRRRRRSAEHAAAVLSDPADAGRARAGSSARTCDASWRGRTWSARTGTSTWISRRPGASTARTRTSDWSTSRTICGRRSPIACARWPSAPRRAGRWRPVSPAAPAAIAWSSGPAPRRPFRSTGRRRARATCAATAIRSCDTDAVSGQCTIEVQPCAAGDDARIACAGESLTAVSVGKLSPASPAIAGALQASLDALLAAGAAPGTCGPAVPVVLPLNGRRTSRLAVRTRAAAGTRSDADVVRLTCQSAP